MRKQIRQKVETKISEANVDKACRDIAALNGFQTTRLQAGLVYGRGSKRPFRLNPSGTPDRLFHRPTAPGVAEMFFLELKRPGKTSTPVQIAKAEELRNIGYLVTEQCTALGFHEWLKANFEGIR